MRGIEVKTPILRTAFRVSPVMTTSIPLRVLNYDKSNFLFLLEFLLDTPNFPNRSLPETHAAVRLCGLSVSRYPGDFRVSPVMTTSIPLRSIFSQVIF